MSKNNDTANDTGNLQAVYDVPLQVSVVLGTAKAKINQVINMSRGSVIELDRKVGEPVDLLINDRLVAKGEIVLVEDRIGVTLTEIIDTTHV